MSKLLKVIRREYLIRVTNKLFLVGTILAPLGIAALMIIPALSSLATREDVTVYVIENGTGITQHLRPSEHIRYIASTDPIDSLKARALDDKQMAVVVVPADLSRGQLTVTYLSTKAPSLPVERGIERNLTQAIRKLRLLGQGLAPDKVAASDVDLSLTTRTLSKDGEKAGSAFLAYIMGNGMAFLIYMMLAIYGQIVMQGVMEEKTNRIMEVMISSVRPIELMFGKIVAIGLVGLTQLVIWMLLMWLLWTGFLLALPLMNIQVPEADPGDLEGVAATAFNIRQAINSFSGWMLPLFVLYFIGGFFIYGSLFAAVGSAVDQPQDASNLAFIPTLPLLVPVIVLGAIISNPNGAMAVWMSHIPLFSPTVMMVRVAAGVVEWWEVALSLLLLIGGVVLVAWLSARIYRVGVLLYGKKVSVGELFKWMLAKT